MDDRSATDPGQVAPDFDIVIGMDGCAIVVIGAAAGALLTYFFFHYLGFPPDTCLFWAIPGGILSGGIASQAA